MPKSSKPRNRSEFDVCLARGNAIERAYIQAFGGRRNPDRRGVDIIEADGSLAELKLDSGATDRLYIEIVSSLEESLPGGIFKAEAEGADWYVLWAAPLRIWFKFAVPALADHIRTNLDRYQAHRKANRGRHGDIWTSEGRIAPIDTLLPFAQLFDELGEPVVHVEKCITSRRRMLRPRKR